MHTHFGQKVVVGGGGGVWGENGKQSWVSVTMVLEPFALEMFICVEGLGRCLGSQR